VTNRGYKGNVFMNYKLKLTAFRDIAPCRPVEADRHSRDPYCPANQDEGGSEHLSNVRQHLRDYTAHYPRRMSVILIFASVRT
jgi:hypothetical protein